MTLIEHKRIENKAHDSVMSCRAERDRCRSAAAVLAYEEAYRVWRAALRRYCEAALKEGKEVGG